MERLFVDRVAAGEALAARLGRFAGGDAVVLALPRGGVPVAAPIAQALGAQLDVMIVRKLGVPGHEELAMGAIASNDVRVLNDDVIRHSGIDPFDIEVATQREKEELARRDRNYRGTQPWPRLQGRPVILVDDGIATGATMMAAIAALRAQQPARIIVAIPVAPADVLPRLQSLADEVICLYAPQDFICVGQWYRNFDQTSDTEVRNLLAQAWGREP